MKEMSQMEKLKFFKHRKITKDDKKRETKSQKKKKTAIPQPPE